MLELNLTGKKKVAVGTTKLLMHFDNLANPSEMLDECGGTFKNTGGVAVTNTKIKFSAVGNFIERYLTLNTPIVLESDYTAEGWVMHATWPGTYGGLFLSSATTGVIRFNSDGTFGLYESSTNIYTGVASGIILNQWAHVASVRELGRYRLYVNGKIKMDLPGNIVPITIKYIGAGTGTTGYQLKAYLDELRIIDGKAMYTDNFTPPTSPFTI